MLDNLAFWHLQKLNNVGNGYRARAGCTDRPSQYISPLSDHSHPAKLGRTPFWVRPLDFDHTGTDDGLSKNQLTVEQPLRRQAVWTYFQSFHLSKNQDSLPFLLGRTPIRSSSPWSSASVVQVLLRIAFTQRINHSINPGGRRGV